MKSKILSMALLGSILFANSNTIPTEEVLNIQPHATQQAAPTQNQAQPSIQDSNTAPAPAPTQNPQMQNMPYPNNARANYGVPLQTILNKVSQMYPGSFITDVDYKGFGYEIEINDNLELFFDMNGNLIGQKWD
ncbi:hypothetical protein LS70_009385 [Helicobacter sp. MIT 11-5569]|uniref:PepSY-like domain-containing protein n=1 Tax=Helicobacter sp. MIT 11-5569 TaxID=1548151 RepID=UPI00051FB769|nr:PepSY-like domain-containing protein [Helicobacter sp. MIT 11-5569]TLD80044.1 hypothetical protein LS70_009385 [Helicobacter sp. MIT 11-5569]